MSSGNSCEQHDLSVFMRTNQYILKLAQLYKIWPISIGTCINLSNCHGAGSQWHEQALTKESQRELKAFLSTTNISWLLGSLSPVNNPVFKYHLFFSSSIHGYCGGSIPEFGRKKWESEGVSVVTLLPWWASASSNKTVVRLRLSKLDPPCGDRRSLTELSLALKSSFLLLASEGDIKSVANTLSLFGCHCRSKIIVVTRKYIQSVVSVYVDDVMGLSNALFL